MSKTNNTRNIVLSILIVLAGAFAIYYALNLESPSYCEDGKCEISSEIRPTSFSQYSWNQLSHIAMHIRNASNHDQAIQIAKQYNLLDANGNLTKETKEFNTSEGVKTEVRIIGIAADNNSGITFLTTNAPYYRNVNASDTTDGGWRESDVRKWLNNDVLSSFPDEIKQSIRPVVKKTSGDDGRWYDGGTVSETEDSLWLLSPSEICGEITWYHNRYKAPINIEFDKVLSDEGAQYQYFKENGVDSDVDPHGVLKFKYADQLIPWWQRPPYIFKFDDLESNYWFSSTSEGYPWNYLAPSAQAGIVYGFCF